MSVNKESVRAALLLVCLLVSLPLAAAGIDAAEAQKAATRFVKSQAAGRLMGSNMEMQLSYTEPSTVLPKAADYYVFNASDGSAFAIVSGDDRAELILGYGEGPIDMADIPCGLQALLDQYKEQMEYLLAHSDAVVEQRRVSSDEVTVAPMLTCDWSQRSPYNNHCPTFMGELSVTGCVATAMAQVMYYWRYPDMAPSMNPYRTRSHNINVTALPPRQLDWDNMLDSYTSPYTPEQGDAVAWLMRYCGQSCRMDYSPTGSGSYVYNQLQGMNSFGYHGGSMLNRSEYSLEDWNELMLTDLTHGMPILYSAADALAGGHAFVVDGYHEGMYHINWGWAATGNGYFALGAFCVRGYTFTSNQQMLHNIHPGSGMTPDEGFDFVAGDIYYMYNEDATGVLVTYKDSQFGNYQGNVVVPATVTRDGETLPVVGIGRSAFRNCQELSGVTLPASIRQIGDYAFRNCINLSRMELPEGVVSIGAQAFSNCMSLQSVSLPRSLADVGKLAFLDCMEMNRVDVPDLDMWFGISFADHYANPLCSAHHLFVNGAEVTDLVVPGTVEAVAPFSFIECTGLTSLTLENGGARVDEAAFAYCTGLKSLSLPGTLKTIGKQAFFGCTGLESVSLPSSLTQLNDAAFSSCTGLKSITIPDSITVIDSNILSDCTGLTAVMMPEGVTTIGTGAFSGCISLDRVSIPATVTTIGDNAFNGCSGMKSLSLPLSVTSIGTGAFGSCSGLEDLCLPNSVAAIGEGAFKNCSGLKSLVLPDSLGAIPQSAFAECSSLTNVTIPDAVTIVDTEAFMKCLKLVEVTLGSNVQTLGKYAFYNNPRLNKVTCKSAVPPEMFNSDCFTRSIYSKSTLMVPIQYITEYKSAPIWSWFGSIKGVDYDSIPGDVNGDGEVNIADVNAIIHAILATRSYNYHYDKNGDGEVNIADVNTVIDIILGGN